MLKTIIITLAGATIVGAAGIWYINTRVSPTLTLPAPAPTTLAPLAPAPPVASPQPTAKTSLVLSIPFTPQAPTANWDELHNEACEEASAIMANAYFSGRRESTLPAAYVETEISKLTDWQKQNFGYNLNTTGEETAKMIEAVYGLKTRIISNFTFDQIKQELEQNHVVIIPEQGRLLGNPNYRQPGPVYHMLIIKGYDKAGVITNDSGTRRGLNYPYAFATIYSAAGNWDHSSNSVDGSKKIAIIVSQ